MTALVVRSDAAHLPLPDSSVDLVVTSPPYFALRSYQDGGQHYAKQVGAEATPQDFLEALWTCTAEWMRVLKPSGSIFVNLGDKYQATSFAPEKRGKDASGVQRPTVSKACERCGTEFVGGPGRRFCSSCCGGIDNSPRSKRGGTPVKSLMLLPERYRIGCVDRLGLIARAVIIWDKPNGLPESVTDRVRRSHEDWVHLTLAPRYYSAIDEIREPHNEPPRAAYGRTRPVVPGGNRGMNIGTMDHAAHRDMGQSQMGKLPGSVWTVATEPLNVPDHLGVDHFAAFPTEWPRRIIQGWSPAGICTACGEGRRVVLAETGEVLSSGAPLIGGDAFSEYGGRQGDQRRVRTATGYNFPKKERIATGYACACPTPDPPTRPAVVLDPFGGTGTTALCASVLGRIGVSVDLSHDYSRLAQWRTQDPGQRAKAMRVEKPPVQLDGQIDMFGDVA